MEIIPTELSGVKIVRPRVFKDSRGIFVKTFHAPDFLAAGLELNPREEFFSVSCRNVIRGMHFQLPPHTQTRLVGCLTGRILDVIVDLRKDAGNYGRVWSRELSAASREMLFIPHGFAHGFVVLEDNTLVSYVADFPYSAPHDAGIAWNSIDFAWPVEKPILSERDQKLPALREFQSPF
jgi:dTDP-4-dehydrorhamnose 3,5-epimerase